VNLLKKIEKIEKEYSRQIELACDEAHEHSIMRDCFHGNPEIITLLKLCQTIRILLFREERAKRELLGEEDFMFF
jgi:hypothetical protein